MYFFPFFSLNYESVNSFETRQDSLPLTVPHPTKYFRGSTVESRYLDQHVPALRAPIQLVALGEQKKVLGMKKTNISPLDVLQNNKSPKYDEQRQFLWK